MATWEQVISDLNVWKRGDERAVHKPLLLLFLLARAQRRLPNELPFPEIEEPLRDALKEFGPSRKSYHPEFPFWHLQSEGVWGLSQADEIRMRASGTNPSAKELRDKKAVGRVPDQLWARLLDERGLIPELAGKILNEYWPETLHQQILDQVGLEVSLQARLRRDPAFRVDVIRAYEGRCAICGYDGRLGNVPFGLEAAHVRWKACSGPDSVDNGLALCAIHHIGLDSGAITVSGDLRVLVSQDLRGQEAARRVFIEYSGKPVQAPQSRDQAPKAEFLAWHLENVFKKPHRELA